MLLATEAARPAFGDLTDRLNQLLDYDRCRAVDDYRARHGDAAVFPDVTPQIRDRAYVELVNLLQQVAS